MGLLIIFGGCCWTMGVPTGKVVVINQTKERLDVFINHRLAGRASPLSKKTFSYISFGELKLEAKSDDGLVWLGPQGASIGEDGCYVWHIE